MRTDGWAGPVVGFDTETTGVDVRSDRIVTAALVRRHGTATTVTTWLLDPGVPVPPDATAVHGVTTAHARNHGRPPAEALAEVADALAATLARGEPVVAFNAAFDLSILDAELARHGLPSLSDRLARDVRVVLDPLVLDRTLDGARPGRRRLCDLVEVYCGGRAGGLHRADVDARATLAVLDGLARRFPHLVHADLHDLHDHQVRAHHAWVERRNAELRAAAATTPDPAAPVRWAEPGWPLRTTAPRTCAVAVA